jgi:hypothetical protein
MKTFLLALILLTNFSVLAKDMSRTETYDESYKDLPDGSNQYVGGCSLHQDYEGIHFKVSKTIVESFEPRDLGSSELKLKLYNIEKELLIAASSEASNPIQFFADVDDVTLEKLSSKTFKHLDLYRFNIGVGGGNGYYEVYSRIVRNGKIQYTKLSNVFDGDVEFCDSVVWLKKD